MNSKERRKFPRIATHHLHLNIILTEFNPQQDRQIQCEIANISFDGLLIVTPQPINSQEISLGVADLENNLETINGRVVYCEEILPGMFHVGIAFFGSNMEKFKFFSHLMEIQDDITTLELDSIHKDLEKASGIDGVSTHNEL